MLPKAHDNVPPAIEQLPAPVPPAMDHVTPVPDGSGSETVPFCARPGPVLDTVMTQPIGSPASTVAWSADLVMWTKPQLTVILTWSTWSEPTLDVVTVAVLSTVPQVAAVVGEVM